MNIMYNFQFYSILIGVLVLLSPSLQATSHFKSINIQQHEIIINYQDNFEITEQKLISSWLEKVFDSLLTVYGELPNESIQINIKRSTNQTSAVPWGHVERGKPAKILLVLNPEFGYHKLLSDWTAFHEFSHLLIPYRGFGDIWLSEGLATYYQNIIQTRSGLFNEKKMWHKILAGFERGKKDQRWKKHNLTITSNKLRESRQYMRVHWSGVLFWLTADVKLRAQNKGTLDDALKKIKYCCETQSMSATEIVHKLDALTGMRLFVPLFHQFSKSYSIPDYTSILIKLGVSKNQVDHKLLLNNDAAFAAIRKKLIQPH